MKKTFLYTIISILLIATIAIFSPSLYIRFEIEEYMFRVSDSAEFKTDEQVKRRIESYINNLNRKIEIRNIDIVREPNYIAVSVDYLESYVFSFNNKDYELFKLYNSLKTKG